MTILTKKIAKENIYPLLDADGNSGTKDEEKPDGLNHIITD